VHSLGHDRRITARGGSAGKGLKWGVDSSAAGEQRNADRSSSCRQSAATKSRAERMLRLSFSLLFSVEQ
jgi:hypothetical protein